MALDDKDTLGKGSFSSQQSSSGSAAGGMAASGNLSGTSSTASNPAGTSQGGVQGSVAGMGTGGGYGGTRVGTSSTSDSLSGTGSSYGTSGAANSSATGSLSTGSGMSSGTTGASAASGSMANMGGSSDSDTSVTMFDEEEDQYWSENYGTRPYASEDRDYQRVRPAYQYGASAFQQHGGRRFEELDENTLRSGWESHRQSGSQGSAMSRGSSVSDQSLGSVSSGAASAGSGAIQSGSDMSQRSANLSSGMAGAGAGNISSSALGGASSGANTRGSFNPRSDDADDSMTWENVKEAVRDAYNRIFDRQGSASQSSMRTREEELA
jgi:hypothetical protein